MVSVTLAEFDILKEKMSATSFRVAVDRLCQDAIADALKGEQTNES